MIVRMSVIGLLLAAAGAAWALPTPSPAKDKARIRSTYGFSFLPPPGQGWTEEFGGAQISYIKQTDPYRVTFYTQALETLCTPARPGKDALLAFVREKDQWGSDGRFTPVSSRFVPEPAQPTCVRYDMVVKDHGARNLGTHPFLLLHVIGRYCTHPQNPGAAVDIAYSIRHVPGYDARAYKAEGEAFLDSLAFDARPAQAGIALAGTRPCSTN